MKLLNCYIGPEISQEQFIPEHFFVYLVKGTFSGYDGNKYLTLKAGESCLAIKNHLARYTKQKIDGEYQKVVVIFDEPFLKKFQYKYKPAIGKPITDMAFIQLRQDEKIQSFIQSLIPTYKGMDRINNENSDLKREELLLMLLRLQPELTGVLFNYGIPDKINLEAFMNKNYKFNVGMERFAFLTGRSISSFKRDFKSLFNETPSRWLLKRRLHEAYFLIDKKHKKPNDIYFDLGFEDLSHFSFAFKRFYGQNPTEILKGKKTST
jgi:AraC family transcriptional regulator, exoenzyme S synthesis regulatory protein ExsA